LVCPQEYCVRPLQEPVFVFCVDLSLPSLRTGFAVACLRAVEAALEAVPVTWGNRMRVGLMTFDSTMHFYRFRDGELLDMVVAVDAEDACAPVPPREWLLNLND
ncbi:unnamed protein product, partial [Discosporangium mesarthrocarpum]